MARRYLLPRAPRPQPSTIHEEGAAAAGQHHGLSYAWEEEEEEAEATAAAAGPKLDAQEGDLRRLPNTSLSRAELIWCYHEALEVAERQLQQARQAAQRAGRGEEGATAGGKDMGEKVMSSSTASTHSPSGGSSSTQHHAFLSPSSRAASARGYAGAAAGGGRTAGGAAVAPAPSPLEYVNALALGGHVKDEVVETVKRVRTSVVCLCMGACSVGLGMMA